MKATDRRGVESPDPTSRQGGIRSGHTARKSDLTAHEILMWRQKLLLTHSDVMSEVTFLRTLVADITAYPAAGATDEDPAAGGGDHIIWH